MGPHFHSAPLEGGRSSRRTLGRRLLLRRLGRRLWNPQLPAGRTARSPLAPLAGHRLAAGAAARRARRVPLQAPLVRCPPAPVGLLGRPPPAGPAISPVSRRLPAAPASFPPPPGSPRARAFGWGGLAAGRPWGTVAAPAVCLPRRQLTASARVARYSRASASRRRAAGSVLKTFTDPGGPTLSARCPGFWPANAKPEVQETNRARALNRARLWFPR